jgi:hypothetical protein
MELSPLRMRPEAARYSHFLVRRIQLSASALASVALITFTRQPAKVKAVPEGSVRD